VPTLAEVVRRIKRGDCLAAAVGFGLVALLAVLGVYARLGWI
jgi:hypothetical protein